MRRLAALAAVVLAMAGCEGDHCYDASGNDCKAARDAQRVQANREKMASHFAGSKIILDDSTLKVFRDRANGVTCWSRLDYSQTLSCLPDWMLTGTKERL